MRRLLSIHWLDRLILRLGMVLAGLIVVGILLTLLDANRDNFIVSFFTEIGEFLAAPFDDMFTLADADARVALNGGIGAFVYFILGVVVAGLIGRLTSRAAE